MSGTVAAITADLLELAGLDRGGARRITVSGPATVLPSSFPVTEAATALVAAVSVAVGDVAALRDHRSEAASVSVDSVEACAAFQSERHLRVSRESGRWKPPLWDDLSGHYETNDGYVQFHTNFEHHRNALLSATGCGPDADRATLQAAVARSGRFELEDTITAAGGIAAAMRSPEEWSRHPHAIHVAGRGPLLMTVQGAGSAKPLGTAGRARPLAGLRVLDLTRVIAGPVCTRTLAAYGAEVLRIGAEKLPVIGALLPDTTLGKRFADCDLTDPGGRDRLLGLASEADVVVMGFRPHALADRGFGHADLLDANPDLVIAELSAFGPDGPWGARRGFDSITQTATGVVAAETAAFGSDRPRPLPCQLLDHGSGYLLSLGILSALASRHRDGGSRTVTASLLTTRNWLASLGRSDPSAGRQLAEADVAPFLESRESSFGTIDHVRHPGRISGIPARWDRGPTPPGTDDARW